MLIPPGEDRRWVVARQMGVTKAIAKLAPELTGKLPPWNLDALRSEVARYRDGGFEVIGLEGDQFDMNRIKLGVPGRDEDIDKYRNMLRNMGQLGIRLLCLNFMVHFGWYRTQTSLAARGGASVSAFDLNKAERDGLTEEGEILPERVWANLEYFLKAVAPVAEEHGVTLGLHPDDPPTPRIRGIARVLTGSDAVLDAIGRVQSSAVRATFCMGTFATAGENVSRAARKMGRDRIAFIHVRDVRGQADFFRETFPDEGQIDMREAFETFADLGLSCPIRPDHAPAMDGDRVQHDRVDGINVGYEANGMIFTVGYMKGLLEANGLYDARH
ncbi:MAG: mannonate dehydratase [Hyphomonas sp.]|nr:mannonate dehydratase [Hyphomonas sp.]